MKYIVVAYDISSNKRRKKVADLLCGCGVRVNKSVFECVVTDDGFKKLKTDIAKLINKKSDMVNFYFLCKECCSKIERTSAITTVNNQVIVI